MGYRVITSNNSLNQITAFFFGGGMSIIRLKSLSFIGFRRSDRIGEVVFSDSQSTVIYSDNGTGKTAFINLLHSFLAQNDNDLAANSVSLIRCTYEYGNNLGSLTSHTIIVPRIASLNLDSLEMDSSDSKFDWSNFLSSELSKSNSIVLGVERGVSRDFYIPSPRQLHQALLHTVGPQKERSLSIPFDSYYQSLMAVVQNDQMFNSRRLSNRRKSIFDVIDFQHSNIKEIKIDNIEEILITEYVRAKNLVSSSIQKALFDTLSSQIRGGRFNKNNNPNNKSITLEDFESLLLSNKEQLIQHLLDSDAELSASIIEALNNIEGPNQISELYGNSLVQILLVNLIGELKAGDKMFMPINNLINRFNMYLSGGKKLEIHKNSLKVRDGGINLTINELSSGERHILTLLTLVLVVSNSRNFLVIDEPEISLNIKWQRNLLDIFEELAPNTQIIVASHSPAIPSKKPKRLTKLMIYSND